MARAFIGLGSNLGDGRGNLQRAWQMLEKEAGKGVALSPPFLTEPVDMESDFLFTNAVGILATYLTPKALLEKMLAVEAALGRDRARGKDRSVDLDLLYFDGLVMDEPGLTLPHPEIANRLFVLEPMARIAPDHVHPVTGRTTREMLLRLGAVSTSKILSWEER